VVVWTTDIISRAEYYNEPAIQDYVVAGSLLHCAAIVVFKI